MKKVLVTTLVILGLALVAAIVYCVDITKDRDSLNTELESVQSVLASTQGELSSTKSTLEATTQMLTSTLAELGSTKQTLVSTQAELGSTKNMLASTQTELTSTKNTLASTQSELETVQQTSTELQATLSTTQQQLKVAQETLGGLGITLSASKENYDADLIDNTKATNPTWAKLMTFLSQDQTEKNTYIRDVYDCSEYSRDVHNNAEAAGIRAAVVHIDFSDWLTSGHALNAFLTTDYGLVYVDCTDGPDTIARVKDGKKYRSVEINRVSPSNVRNDFWWDVLESYYYIDSMSSYNLSLGRWGESVTSSIRIFW